MENIDKLNYSPMIRQYLEVKENYPDTLLFYRVGDFYELFFNDAIVASNVLEIVLTGKDAGVDERVPMCGVPFHAAETYVDILTKNGYKVAIVEQVEDPALAKGLVKREVVRIITPGTTIDEGALDSTENNYIASVSYEKTRFIIATLDMSTGEANMTSLPTDYNLMFAELLKFNVKEIVLNSKFNRQIFDPLTGVTNIILSIEDSEEVGINAKTLVNGLDDEETRCYARLLNYLTRTQMRTLIHLQKVNKYDSKNYLRIDLSSRRNLELLETLRFQTKQNTLLSVLNKCSTAMGTRCLKRNLSFPLIDKNEIVKRFDTIDAMKKAFIETQELRHSLQDVYDLERIIGRISYENANPKDLLQLKRSLGTVPKIIDLLKKIKIDNNYDLVTDYDKYSYVYSLIDASISDDAPFSLKEGGVIKAGYNERLDEFRNINQNVKEFLVNLEAEERARTGIKQLKVGYNKVFGYYIEVSKLNSELIKDEYGYIRKQTLANAERYITQELKEKESMILRAEEESLKLEKELFGLVRNDIKNYTAPLQKLAKVIALLDMMQAFTKVANENHYVRPQISDGDLEIIDGRHPVVEVNSKFVSNDTLLRDGEILLITGPNMSGKSTYMRQVALIAIMTQIGSFVPAKSAKMPIFDSIFTRIGAADDIVSGQSTFMVEMSEVNNALKLASHNSLIIFDEIGRGTATFDGMALAQAILEYIHSFIKAKTLFSTHYHELTVLDEYLENLRNIHVSALEENGDVKFLHKVENGPVDKSYGVNVAKLAHLPSEVIIRANDLLFKLEAQNKVDKENISPLNYRQPLIFDSKTDQEKYVLNDLEFLDINELSPLDALNKLNEYQKKIKG